MKVNQSEAKKEIQKLFDDKIKRFNLFLFCGDLGSGKTTLISSIITKLTGERYVNSPTYTIVNSYPWNGRQLFHVDLYRLETIEDLLELGIFEEDEDDPLYFVEWPDDFMGFFNKREHVMINLDKTENENERELNHSEHTLH